MRPVRKADNLATFMRRLSEALRASTSWSPQGLSRPYWDTFTFTTSLPSIHAFHGAYKEFTFLLSPDVSDLPDYKQIK